MTCTGGGKVVVALSPELKAFKSGFTGVEFQTYAYAHLGLLSVPCLLMLVGDTNAVFVRSNITDVYYNPPILCIGGNSNITFKGITVVNNRGTGLLVLDNATVLFTEGSKFINTTGGYIPSAIVAADRSCVTMSGKSIVQANLSPGCGGGFHVQDNSKLLLTGGSIVSNNSGMGGGGLCVRGNANVTICCGSSIANNTSHKPGGCHGGIVGGGIRMSDKATVYIKIAEISHNRAAIGGGIYVEGNSAKLVAEDSAITGNRAIVGGAVALEAGATLMLHNTKLARNAALAGGAIYAGNNTRVNVDKCSVTGNAATAGGALFAAVANASFRSSSISSNLAVAGGGVWAESSTVAITERSIVNNNSASVGGALFGAAAARFVLASGSIVTSNAAQFGSGIWLQDRAGALATFASGAQLASSDKAATGTLPTAPLPTDMADPPASDDGWLKNPGAPDPVIPATTPSTPGSTLSLPERSRCSLFASHTSGTSSYLHALYVATTVGAKTGSFLKPTGVRSAVKCPDKNAGSGSGKPPQQASLC
eukprot:gene12380-12514_t